MRGALPEDLDVRVRTSWYYSTGLWRRLADIVGAALRRADVYHVTGDVHFLTYMLPRRRTVLTVLDCGLGRATGLTGVVFRVAWLRLPVARAVAVVAISETTAAELAELGRIPIERIYVIPITIDERFVPVPRDPVVERPVVLLVGTNPNKNLERTADALRGLDVELRVIGRLSDEQRSHLDDSGVAWRHDVGISAAEMRRAYADCDVVAFASTYEGFGMPIVEGNAVGRPVVTSDRAPMNDVADGAACLVDPESVASIRAGFERVLNDESYRAELVARGFENRERFRPARAAAMYAELYREVAGAARARRWS